MLNNIKTLRKHFLSGKTLDISHRLTCLTQFELMIDAYEDEMISAVYKDFKKPNFETLATEIVMLRKEISYFKKRLKKLVKPQKVTSSILNFPSTDYLVYKPYGVVLIIAPWNYPLLLSLQPLLAALVTGNCVVLKPSEYSTATSHLIYELIPKYFDENLVKIVLGGVDETSALLKNKFDKIFFTGSTTVGKIIYQAAAKYLTPVVLELGGKSPCVITKNANLKIAAKRIAFGKFVNAGQTCIAPDFIYIDKTIEDQFIAEFKLAIEQFYGENPENSTDFARIINQKNFNRLLNYLNDGEILIGGSSNPSDLYIEPTVLKVVDFNKDVMQNEIFGPVLPIITYQDISEVIVYNHNNPKPLAFYVFSDDTSEVNYLLNNCMFGGASINDCLTHIINHRLPFGGVGDSGMGNYHGKFSFEAFSHVSGVIYRANWLDFKIKYPPYKQKTFHLLKKITKYL